MTTQHPAGHQPSRGLQILKTVLYILAGLVLIPGLITAVSLIAGANSMVANLLMPIQLMGGGAFSNMLAPMLTGFLINIGFIILILSIILSALLYAVGRLIGHTSSLEARLARLEARV